MAEYEMKKLLVSLAVGKALFLNQAVADEQVLELGLPIRCELGKSCFVQSYVDHDPGPGSSDYMCKFRSYNDHNGTDFRLLSDKARRDGYDVLAAAAGTVARARDGVEDISIRSTSPEAVRGQECGNGVVIEHGNGWETQYCHMAKGSLIVKPGQHVAKGESIGRVGLSGLTEFPHLHITVRHEQKVVDPFAHRAAERSCGGGRSLWDPKLANQLVYKPSEVLNVGFTGGTVTMERIEADDVSKEPVKKDSALVAYARAIGLQQGDVQELSILKPDGSPVIVHKVAALAGNKAQVFIAAGRKAQAQPWPTGTYRATYAVRRNNALVLTKEFSITLD